MAPTLFDDALASKILGWTGAVESGTDRFSHAVVHGARRQALDTSRCGQGYCRRSEVEIRLGYTSRRCIRTEVIRDIRRNRSADAHRGAGWIEGRRKCRPCRTCR